MWTTLTWIFIPFLALNFGINGAAFGYALVGTSSLIAMIIAHKIVRFSFAESVIRPFLGTLGMSVVLLLIRAVLPSRIYSVWILIASGGLFYLTIMYFIVGPSILIDAKKGIKAIFSRS